MDRFVESEPKGPSRQKIGPKNFTAEEVRREIRDWLRLNAGGLKRGRKGYVVIKNADDTFLVRKVGSPEGRAQIFDTLDEAIAKARRLNTAQASPRSLRHTRSRGQTPHKASRIRAAR